MSTVKITKDIRQFIMVNLQIFEFLESLLFRNQKYHFEKPFLAAMSNNPEVVESLIAAGAKVNYQYDRINDTLAHISIKKGNAKILNILLR